MSKRTWPRNLAGTPLLLAIPVGLICLPPMLWEPVRWYHCFEVLGMALGAGVLAVVCIWLLRSDPDEAPDIGPPYVPRRTDG